MELYFVLMIIIGFLLVLLTFKIITRNQILKQKGEQGEKSVLSVLSHLPKRKYRIIHNLLLKTNQGTTQIDHLVISKYGIFVIETKNYQGMIIGNEYIEYWTQHVAGHNYQLYNPIKQNLSHIHAVKPFIKHFKKLPVISIVAFSNESNLQVYSETAVVHFSMLYKTIRSFRKRRVSKKKMLLIYEDFIESNLTSKQEHKKHINFVKMNVKAYKKNVKKQICPRCGSKLVKRRRHHKKVLVCKNKNKCKYIYYKN